MRKSFLILSAATLAIAATAGVANARGCNGYVNQMQWGCAPWDNNNGPQFPHWQGAKPQSRPAPQLNTRFQNAQRQNMINNNLYNRNANGVINAGGANVINAGGAN